MTQTHPHFTHNSNNKSCNFVCRMSTIQCIKGDDTLWMPVCIKCMMMGLGFFLFYVNL